MSLAVVKVRVLDDQLDVSILLLKDADRHLLSLLSKLLLLKFDRGVGVEVNRKEGRLRHGWQVIIRVVVEIDFALFRGLPQQVICVVTTDCLPGISDFSWVLSVT